MRSAIVYLAGVAWMASFANGLAVVRYVPSGGTPMYSTIQGAIKWSEQGDTIRVQPGVYHECITFRGVDITLTSINPGDSNIVQTTVLQGDGTNSVVTFSSGQGRDTLFTGFTVRGGGGTLVSDYTTGGGIYCSNSSPSIVGNIIEENHAPAFNSLGGAIACWDCSPRIARNIIRNNSACVGGAIDSRYGIPLIEDNWIYNNTATLGTGGAAFLLDQGRFLNNTLFQNTPNNLEVQMTGLMANNIIVHSNVPTNVIDVRLSWFKNNNIWVMGSAETLPAGGTNGNFSCDPLFVNATNFDLHLTATSPCINAGDVLPLRSTNELDFDGGSRVFAYRVDVGASEFRGARNFAPTASATDRRVGWVPGAIVVLDGAASIDPEGAPLSFSWSQTVGPSVSLAVTNNQAYFTPPSPAEYRFNLVVNDGVYDSAPVTCHVVVTCPPPVASAGLGQSLAAVPEIVALDGSHSLDQEGQTLFYHWRQVGGPTAELTDPHSVRPSFRPPGPGTYNFELTVSNQFSISTPDRVTFYLGPVPPVANAGSTLYVSKPTYLDGSASFALNTTAPLEYAWRQVSGPSAVLMAPTTVKPLVRLITRTNIIQELVFELVVKAGGLTSAPSTVRVVAVPVSSNTVISQVNGAFDPNRPTVVSFGGGNCDSGGLFPLPAEWNKLANVFTCDYTRDPTSQANDPRYFGYGDQLILQISALAPNYNQPIQTVGFSTGNMPAIDVAERLNVTYKDPRYVVSRVSFFDSACRDFGANIRNLNANRIPGKPFWIDNYYSVAGRFQPGVLNVNFFYSLNDAHGMPMHYYLESAPLGTPYCETNFNNGVFAGSFFSVVGPGKNYQLETGKSEYYFGWDPSDWTFSTGNLVQMEPFLYPGRFPGVVELIGPANAALAAEGKVVFSCPPVLNAATYQILVGSDALHVDRIAWEGATPPNQPLPRLPFTKTWWTIRATDAYGTTSWADPRYVVRDSDADGLSDEAEVLTYHTDPDNRDTDADGHLDQQEVLVGTDPLRPNAGFQLTFQLVSANQLRFSWFSDSGNSYDLESSTTLASNSWQRIGTYVAPAVPGLMRCIIPLSADTARFYRVKASVSEGN